jgi:hypothetical protein
MFVRGTSTDHERSEFAYGEGAQWCVPQQNHCLTRDLFERARKPPGLAGASFSFPVHEESVEGVGELGRSSVALKIEPLASQLGSLTVTGRGDAVQRDADNRQAMNGESPIADRRIGSREPEFD